MTDTKFESGHRELEDEPLEPVRVVEESVEILAKKARAKRLELLTEVDAAVPAWIRGNRFRLRRVLVNLIGNAVKFTESGEVLVRVQVTGNGLLEFAVADTGIGITELQLATLFQASTHADAYATRQHGGTGLGLAISKRLVVLMGGEIRVSSVPGSGSTFAFTVPLRRHEVTDVIVPSPAADLAGRRILIVDGNATNLRILRRQLERWSAVPVIASEGAAALEILAADASFDAAVLDYHMPDMDGVMLARRLKALAPSLPMVLLSSSMSLPADEAEAGLFAALLLKPVRQEQMRAALAAALGAPSGPAAVPVTLARRAPRIASGHAATARLRVLVVDDVDANRGLAQALLRRLGHESDAVDTGLAAVERACTGRYDTVLMDVQMPDIDGLEAMRRIRQRLGAAAPRIVAVTAHALSGDRERCLAAGMDGYLVKPINPAAFAAELGAPLRPVAEPAARQDEPPAPESVESLVDRVRIQTLLEYDDEEQSMVRAIIDTFLHDAPRYLEAVRDALTRHDREQVAHHAHALKGAASNAAAPVLSEIASRLEVLARNGERDDLAQLVEKLDSTYERSAVALVAELERLARRK